MSDTTIALVTAFITLAAVCLTFIQSIVNSKKIAEVHVLVNSQMVAALKKIGDLEARVISLSNAALSSRDTGIPPPDPYPEK